MNAKGWYSTKTLVNTRTSNADATVVHRPTRFVDSQPEDDGSIKGPTSISEPGDEPPFALVPLRKRPFPRSPTEPTSPRRRTQASQDVCDINDSKTCTRAFSPSAVIGRNAHGSDGCDQVEHTASHVEDADSGDDHGSDASDQSAYDDQGKDSSQSASSSFGCDDKLDGFGDSDGDGDDNRDESDRGGTRDLCGDDDDVMSFDDNGNVDTDERHEERETAFNRAAGVGHAMHWSENSDNSDNGDNDGDDMPSAADWKRSPAAATAVCLRAEERRLQMLCKVHEAVLRQTEAALDGVRFAIRRLDRMHRRDA